MKQLILTLAFVLTCCSLALGQTTKTSTASDCPLTYSNLSFKQTIPSTGERVEMKFFSCRVGPGGILIYQMKGVALITPVSIDLTKDPVEVKFRETDDVLDASLPSSKSSIQVKPEIITVEVEGVKRGIPALRVIATQEGQFLEYIDRDRPGNLVPLFFAAGSNMEFVGNAEIGLYSIKASPASPLIVRLQTGLEPFLVVNGKGTITKRAPK